ACIGRTGLKTVAAQLQVSDPLAADPAHLGGTAQILTHHHSKSAADKSGRRLLKLDGGAVVIAIHGTLVQDKVGIRIVLQDGGHDLRYGTAHDHHIVSLVAEVTSMDLVVIEFIDFHAGDRNAGVLGK